VSDKQGGDDLARTEIDTGEPVGPQADQLARTEIDPRSVYQPASDRTEIDPRSVAAGTQSPAGYTAPPMGQTIELQPGMKVEQFELISELGRGGMGQVWVARDTKLGRRVALKFLSLHSQSLIQRFLVEARATAQCHHENIVVIYEADEWNGLPYMALEYLEGQPLSALIAEQRLPARRTVELMVPVVRALVRAHELGIVHRDLKPDNIFVTKTGVVKVLDFGIAKLFGQEESGGLMGTMPYMSPEQWGADEIDHRTDIWALGIIFWEMLARRHPIDPVTVPNLRAMATFLDQPLPAIENILPDLSSDLARIVDGCLAKSVHYRWASASDLLAALEVLVPARAGRSLAADESPFPGMTAFQEADANRFFGRSGDIDHVLHRMRDQALVGVVGASGVGKSSLIRAGVIPALRASEDSWEVLTCRPGRDPIAGLATLLQPLTRSDATGLDAQMAEHQQLAHRLRTEPGFLGTLLRSRARQKRGKILLFVDQFEELYTLVGDPTERQTYAACLAGVADDPSTPLRVVVSMRADLLDRVAESRAFMDRLGPGLLFLAPMDRDGTRAALTEPLELAGYRFENPAMVDHMIDTLEGTPGALPLLQFTAAKLWEQRDPRARMITDASYRALGGIAGALASHADEIVRSMSPAQQRLTRAIFVRLVTADGTRSVADVDELLGLSDHPSEVQALIDQLVTGRLLVVQRRAGADGSAVEIVHESLITSWPTLRRWREESVEDSAFLEQLRNASRQWESKGRPAGLLWRGEAMEEAQRFHKRYRGELASHERQYLDAVVDLATRSARRRRRLIIAAFAVLSALVVAAVFALLVISEAEQTAQDQRALAETEAERARAAEAEVREKLETIQTQKKTIEKTTTERDTASEKAKEAESQRKLTYQELVEALADARRERARAETNARRAQQVADENKKLADSERAAKKQAEALAAEKQKKIDELNKKLKKLPSL
jgi:hypothetical protein